MHLGSEHLGPWEMAGKEEPEPIASYCDGEGHTLDEWGVVEPCRDCFGKGVRNHRRCRWVEGADL